MIVAGFGCRKGTSAQALLTALDAACGRAGISRESVAMLATGEIKRHEAGLIELAARLSLPLYAADETSLKKAEGRSRTVSQRSLMHTSTPSLSETAALAVAGEGSKLIVARMISGGATCALAHSNDGPKDESKDHP